MKARRGGGGGGGGGGEATAARRGGSRGGGAAAPRRPRAAGISGAFTLQRAPHTAGNGRAPRKHGSVTNKLARSYKLCPLIKIINKLNNP